MATASAMRPASASLAGDLDEVRLVALTKDDPVIGDRCDEEGRRRGRRQQRDEVDVLLKLADRGKALLERDRQQEGEQHLHPRASRRAAR